MLGIIVTLLALFAALSFALHPEDNHWRTNSEWQNQASRPTHGMPICGIDTRTGAR
jgi:hypothetical protein